MVYDYDIIYIKGNPSSGIPLQHDEINESITNLFGFHTFKTVDSNMSNMNFKLPKAKIYIGFSRGSRYLKKLDSKSLKVSIGGISGVGISTFINIDDKILNGDISTFSMNAHFKILDKDKISIKKLIDEFLIIN